jgi:hypothetical protein
MVSTMPHGVVARRRTRGLVASSMLAMLSSVVLVHCQNDDRSNGEACVKDEDCTSGFCSGQVCVAAQPTVDSEPPASDAEADTPADGAPATDAKRTLDSAREANVDVEGTTEAGKDASLDHDKHDTAAPDADAKDGG